MINQIKMTGTLCIFTLLFIQWSTNSMAQQQQQQQKASLGSGLQPDQTKSSFWNPLVNVDKDANKSKVDVHVPIFFDMTNNNNQQTGKSRLDLSVLSGLVTVNRDKERSPNGTVTGPLIVTVFGIPVYSGSGTRPGDLRDKIEDSVMSQARALESSVESLSSRNNATDIAGQIFSNLRKANEKSLRTVAETFGRMSSFFSSQAEPFSEKSGRPADQRDLNQLTGETGATIKNAPLAVAGS